MGFSLKSWSKVHRPNSGAANESIRSRITRSPHWANTFEAPQRKAEVNECV